MLWIDTPGVYFQWTDEHNHLADDVRSDIAGFVGIAARGPLHRPVKVESWAQFVSVFGSPTPQGYLAHAVAGFFANGGNAGWVVRAADPETAKSANLVLRDATGRPALCLEASSPGVWGNRITLRLITESLGRFTLDLRLPGGEHEVWNDLTSAVSSLDLLDHRRRPTLRLVSYLPSLWRYNLAVRVDPHGDRFDLEFNASDSSFEEAREAVTDPSCQLDPQLYARRRRNTKPPPCERFENLSLNPEDERYAPRLLGEGPEASQLVAAYDLFTTSAAPDNLPQRLLPNQRAGIGTLRPEPRHVGRLLNQLESGSRLVHVCAPEDCQEGVMHECLSATPTSVPSWLVEARTPRLPGIGRLIGGEDGLRHLATAHLSGIGAPREETWGLSTLARIHEIGLVAIPDIMPKEEFEGSSAALPPRCVFVDTEAQPPFNPGPLEFAPPFDDLQISALQGALIQHCEVLKDRFALLDPPRELTTAQDVIRWRNAFDTSFAALYYPWLLVPHSLPLTGLLRQVPPSGHVAGIIAASDLQVGVHKPPANERVRGVRELAVTLSEIDHGTLNRAQVNLIRPVGGRGLRLLGARTLSSDTELRYVNVRRMLTMIVDALDKHLAWTVMEPNNEKLWVGVERVVSAYLDLLWRRGQLDGENRQQAFFVHCDRNTNPPEEVDVGRLTCQIGVYLPWPAEFVIVHIGRRQGPLEILEVRRQGVRSLHA